MSVKRRCVKCGCTKMDVNLNKCKVCGNGNFAFLDPMSSKKVKVAPGKLSPGVKWNVAVNLNGGR